MRKNTLANVRSVAGIVLGCLVTLAICYSVSVYLWVQNRKVVTYDGDEIQTTRWNFLPNYFTTGEASNALATGFGLVAAMAIVSALVIAASVKVTRTSRKRVVRSAVRSNTER